MYGKYIRRTTKLLAHDEANERLVMLHATGSAGNP